MARREEKGKWIKRLVKPSILRITPAGRAVDLSNPWQWSRSRHENGFYQVDGAERIAQKNSAKKDKIQGLLPRKD